MKQACSDNLWAITCYFNPVGYRRRLENYRLFRGCLNVPLVTVELSFDGTFQLRPGDADILVQIHAGAILWQKERLLNVALSRVPEGCRKIAWLDCDIVFGNTDWSQRASRVLDEFPIVHLFEERVDVPEHAGLDQLRSRNDFPSSRSAVQKMAAGDATLEELLLAGSPPSSTVGLAWAGRREVLDEHGFYDACILGSGDRAMLCAALGKFDYGVGALRMNERRKEHYLAWARAYFAAVGGRVAYIPGTLFHLWHGALQDRRYQHRHRQLASFDFDPFADIAIHHNGAWRWASDKRELHAFVKSYFESRNEDGPRTGAARDRGDRSASLMLKSSSQET